MSFYFNCHRNLNWSEICKQLPKDLVILLNKIHLIVSQLCGNAKNFTYKLFKII